MTNGRGDWTGLKAIVTGIVTIGRQSCSLMSQSSILLGQMVVSGAGESQERLTTPDI
jgi:hypothetical protein